MMALFAAWLDAVKQKTKYGATSQYARQNKAAEAAVMALFAAWPEVVKEKHEFGYLPTTCAAVQHAKSSSDDDGCCLARRAEAEQQIWDTPLHCAEVQSAGSSDDGSVCCVARRHRKPTLLGNHRTTTSLPAFEMLRTRSARTCRWSTPVIGAPSRTHGAHCLPSWLR